LDSLRGSILQDEMEFFVCRKNKMISKMITFIKKMKIKHEAFARFLQVDNAKENVAIKTKLELEGIEITPEFTNPNTPQ
jgi:hypothetical protein